MVTELRLARIRQTFPRPVVGDLERELRTAIAAKLAVQPGARIAITAGSRGIANLVRILAATAESVRSAGGEPFIVPAMGSHGGGTAAGQREVLASCGVTEQSVGCPIRSSMEVVELSGATGLECRIFMDRLANEADGVVVLNRIKPHTDFRGRFESGLAKMTAIGLGKAAGAEEIHRFGVRGLRDLLPGAAERILRSGKIVLGIGIVENAYDETMTVEALRPLEILDREPELLELARANMPRLPADRLDVLVVDRIGKNISGTGMDTNIIGRMRIRGQEEPQSPEIAMVVITDLTDDSHGNATGMGLADIATRRMFQKLDRGATNTNIVVSGFYERGKIPLIAETDQQAVEWALRGCGPLSADQVRVARIRDTLHLDELYVSPAVLAELVDRDDVEVVSHLGEVFDDAANLRAF